LTDNKELNPQAIPVAIIGMGCFFPKSSGLKEFWRLIVNGENAIGEVPPTHWTAADYFDADPTVPDHTYCTRGGFLPTVMFDPTEFGIPPNTLEATDTSQLLGLMAAKMALADAGYGDGKAFNRERTSVILGVTGTQELVIPLGARLGFPKWRQALERAGVPAATTEEVVARISDAYVPWQENSFPGLLGNVVAGRICNRLDLGGTNCVVDAACASSLSAVHMALLELTAGRSDMVVSGGVDTLNDIFMHMCFAKTRILSPTGDVRPFSKDADGTVLGEGIGLVVTKRLADAEKDGDRIYAVIRGIGSASDGKSQSIYAPRPEGQALALRNAYSSAGIDPDTVELIEAHGTGTRVGDKVEFQALSQVFDGKTASGSDCAIGSVKSMIGHTKAAAGAAGLIKSALALHHKILPPTLKAEQPDPELGIDQSRFYLNTITRPWLSHDDHPRRCGVSAFGFGGSNFHLVLEEYRPEKTDTAWDGSVEIVAVSGTSKAALIEKIERLKSDIENGIPLAEAALQSRGAFSVDDDCRLLWVIERTVADDRAPDSMRTFFLKEGSVLLEDLRAETAVKRPGLFYGEGRPAGKLAFLFPGQGSQYPGMGRDLVCRFPEAFEALAAADRRFDDKRSLSRAIYPLPVSSAEETALQAAALRHTDIAQPAIGAVSLAMLNVLAAFGVQPDATAGHSFGELTALHAAGWIDQQAFLSLAVSRGRLMAAAGQGEKTPASGMLAVKAPLAEIEALIASSRLDVVLANRNAPRQGVIAGTLATLDTVRSICRDKGYGCVSLPVAAAFHSKYVKEARPPFREVLRTIAFSPTAIPVFSNTTGGPYPADAAGAAALLGDHLQQPVAFIDEIKNLYRAGTRTFLEIGPRSILTGLVADILAGETFEAVAADASAGNRTGVGDMARTLCRLAAVGHPVDLNRWETLPRRNRKSLMQIELTGTNYRTPRMENHGPQQPSTHRPRRNDTSSRPSQPDRSLSATKPRFDRSAHDAESTDMMKRISHPHPFDRHLGTTSNPVSETGSDYIRHALSTLQQGLTSLQALQQQTAETHQKFLDTQIQAGRTLQAMMAQTRRLAQASLDQTETPIPFEMPEQTLPVAPPAAVLESREKSTPGSSEARNPVPVTEVAFQNGLSNTVPESFVRQNTPPETISSAASAAPPTSPEVQRILMEVVSDLTGYPIEMIKADMDIEADLGIDSIKRVEILSTLEERVPDLPAIPPTVMGKMKTLGQVAELLTGSIDDAELTEAASEKKEAARIDTATPETPAAERDQNALLTTLIDVVGELTGYPVEMIKADMDIEADLGIDSIKRVEILSVIEEKMPGLQTVSPGDMGRIKTLEQIAAYLGGSNSDSATGVKPVETPAESASTEAAATRAVPKSESAPVPLRRQVVKVVEAPCEGWKSVTIPAGRKVFITDDGAGLATALADELGRRNIESDLISSAVLIDKPNLSPAAGLVLVASAHSPFTSGDLKEVFRLASRLGPELVESAARGGAVFASVTRMDGAFGFNGRGIDHPLQGALAGLVKTAAIEWDTVHCRAIDVAPDWPDTPAVAAMVADELLHHRQEDAVEIGLNQKRRSALVLEDAPLPAVAPAARAVETGDVVVVSGGARGVTAAVALELATGAQPNLILLGRSPAPEPEPLWLKELTDEAAVKRAILNHEFNGNPTPVQLESAFRRHMANREIASTLAAIRETGSEAHYHSVDVRAADAVRRAIDTVRATHGPVRAVVHGAGVLEDRLIVDKKPEQFERVFDTKVKGLENLLAATTQDPLRLLVLFSSVTARMGNRGQADYAMANEALNKIAQQCAVLRPHCRVKAVNWGPWEGGMVSAGLGQEFRRRGVELISIASGARHLVAEMCRAEDPAVEVVVGAALSGAGVREVPPVGASVSEFSKAAAAADLSLAFKRDLDIGNHPVLRSHMIGGKAVVPLALMTEWFAHGALHGNPGLLLQGLDDIRVLNGIKLDRGKKHIRLMAGKARRKQGAYEVPLELRDGIHGNLKVIHSRARAILVDELPPAPPYRIPAKLTRRSYDRTIADVYDRILFHGPDMRGLREITHLCADGMVADVAPAPAPSVWVKEPLRNRWLSDPLALDAAFQMATIWCFEEKGAVSLPSYCAAYRQYRSRFPAEGVTAVLEITAAGDHKMQGTITFLDADGTVVAQMSGCEAVMDPALQKAFRPAAA
jgi:acyl transferase domain-containing protein/NAD(P)-dependent dehydrogenase (short-subunit alcohol dehydrogenase family)/acyl carrier protein